MKLTEKYLPYLMHVWMSFAIERRIRKLERKIFELDMRVDNLEKAIMPA